MATTDSRKRVTAVAPLVLALLSLSTSALQADQGGTRAGAETLSLPSEVDAALTARDRDYFRIDLTAPGRLDIHSSGNTDTVGRFESATGTRLVTDNDGGQGRNFRIRRDVTAGTYYLMVRGRGASAGNYRLHADFTEADHGDSKDTARTISIPSQTNAELTFADEDWFKVVVKNAGWLDAWSSGNLDTEGFLDAEVEDSRWLAVNDDGGANLNFRFRRKVEPGNYYIRVKGIGNARIGSYTLHVRLTEERPDHGDTRDTATLIQHGFHPHFSKTAGTLTTGDRDWFKIVTQSNGRLTIRSDGDSETTYGQLYNAGGGLLAARDDIDGKKGDFKLTRELRPGTYFIQVSGWNFAERTYSSTGDYTLEASWQLVLPTGDGRQQATSISLPHPDPNPDAGPFPYGIRSPSDVDWFRIVVPSPGGKLDVRTSGPVNTVGQLESSDGTVLTTDRNSGNGDNFRVVHDVTAGTYYVRVASENRSDFGVYYLHADLTIIPPVDPGSTRDGALTVAVPASVAEELTNRDRDYYRIDLPSDGRLTLHSSSDIDTVGRLEDATGTRLTTDNDSGKGRNFRISRDVTAGTYYLMVRGRGSSTGRYTLHADFDATDTADGAGRADPERALGHSLAELARDALDQSSTVIERRIEGGGTTRLQAFAGLFGAEGPGEQMRYDNHPEPVSGDQPESYTIGDLRNLVRTQGFAVSPDSTTLDGRPQLTFWGQGDGVAEDGTLFLGMDARMDDRWTAGVALAESEGSLALPDSLAQARISTLYPYVKTHVGDNLTIWSIAGSGSGTLDDRSGAGRGLSSDLDLEMGLLGAERMLHQSGKLSLSAAGDAGWSRLSVKSGEAAGVSAAVTRTRLGLRMDYDSPDSGLTGNLRLSARTDGGDGETGTGLEILGEASWIHNRWQASSEARQHSAGMPDSKGFSARLGRVRHDDGTGLGFELSHGRGTAVSGRSGRAGGISLLPTPKDPARATDERQAWLGSRMSWGMKQSTRSLIVPHADLRVEQDGGRHLRAGIDFGSVEGTTGLALAFENGRENAADRSSNAVTLRFAAEF